MALFVRMIIILIIAVDMTLHNNIQVSQKWRTNDALRCRRDYHKRQKNVKKNIGLIC
jgi:hypothetical protein